MFPLLAHAFWVWISARGGPKMRGCRHWVFCGWGCAGAEVAYRHKRKAAGVTNITPYVSARHSSEMRVKICTLLNHRLGAEGTSKWPKIHRGCASFTYYFISQTVSKEVYQWNILHGQCWACYNYTDTEGQMYKGIYVFFDVKLSLIASSTMAWRVETNWKCVLPPRKTIRMYSWESQ